MCKNLVLTLALASCFLEIGCGGSGSSKSTSSNTTVPLSSNERILQTGDSWTYSFKGSFTPSSNSSQSASGTETITVTSAISGTVNEISSFSFTAGGKNYSVITTIVLKQASDGSTTLVSYANGTSAANMVISTSFTDPGTLTSSTAASGKTTFADDSVEVDSVVVLGQGKETTPLATFNCWQVQDTSVLNNVTISNYTELREPSLGHPAFLTGTSVFSIGTVNGTFSLKTTTVPLA